MIDQWGGVPGSDIGDRRPASLTMVSVSLNEVDGRRAPRDDDPLAPGGLEAVLAPEVSTRPIADPEASSGADPPDEERESHMGRGTHCE